MLGMRQPPDPGGGEKTAVRTREDWLIETLADFVSPFSRIFPTSTEVVLHDLRRLPSSIAAIAGDVTGRRIGDPATNVLLAELVADTTVDLAGYESRTGDGRRLHSSTTIMRDADGAALAALCVNTEIHEHAGRADADADLPDVESFAASLIAQAVDAEGVPLALMKKRHKLSVVSRLRDEGLFRLRAAIDDVALALDVSRFTIYNYLSELEATHPPGGRRSAP